MINSQDIKNGTCIRMDGKLYFCIEFLHVKPNRPNIVLFLVDDMGWQDTSLPFWTEQTPLNRRYETPNMERLAKQGMMFTQAYACSVSSPTRVSLYTGMNASRHHGDTDVDSHFALPVLAFTRERLDSVELYPFKQYIKAGLGGIMVGHLQVPIIEPNKLFPSSLSRNVVYGLLADELRFQGLIFTDALAMLRVLLPKDTLPNLQNH